MNELSPEQLAQLGKRLAEVARELEAMLASSREGAGPVDLDEPIGRLSRMEAIQQSEMTAANRAASERRLQLVTAARSRLTTDADSFGLCVSCEEAVGYARLSARPEASLCVRCQSARERG